MPERGASLRRWQNLWVRLAVALAFADASIVVLALPQLVDRLHSSISHVVWVIVAYNLALIAGSLAILPIARRLASARVLVAGLALFGLASLGCGASNSLAVLIPLRCVQGFGGALILCASLPLFAGAARPGESPLIGWAAAAAIGAAVGPAMGGVLTEIFSWRSIFYAQAPVAAIAGVAVVAARVTPAEELADDPAVRAELRPLVANLALLLLSAGLIGALFLVVIEMINAWLLSPIGAAAVVTTLPFSTALAERAVRGRSPLLLGAVGSVLVAGGLGVLAAVSHRQLGVVVIGLALCGAGLGLGFPGLTSAALGTRGPAVARAAKTIAARDAGLVLGLLALTPVFVNQLDAAAVSGTAEATGALLVADLPLVTKFELAPKLQAAVSAAPQSRPPDVHPVFAQMSARVSPSVRVNLLALEKQLDAIIERSATHPFRKPLLYGALFALAVLPLLAGSWLYSRRRRSAGAALEGCS